jgi:hypothetical protein
MPSVFENNEAKPFDGRASQEHGGARPPADRNGAAAPLLDAVKVTHLSSQNAKQSVTYCVTDVPSNAKSQDRRRLQRKRTKLRCGKVLDSRGNFLIECQVRDRSVSGAQLRLMRSVTLPRRIKLYDDEYGALLDADVIWRRNSEIGVQFTTKLNAQSIRLGRLSALAGKYYALR